MTAPRRRGAAPDAGAVADLTAPPAPAGALTKAPEQDPVLAAAARPARAATRGAGAAVKEQLKVWSAPGLPGRLRAAFLATREQTGYRSVSELVEHAVEAELRKLERKHHGGQPWEPVQPGVVPTGRPVGS